jgi:hypothetical protein
MSDSHRLGDVGTHPEDISAALNDVKDILLLLAEAREDPIPGCVAVLGPPADPGTVRT